MASGEIIGVGRAWVCGAAVVGYLLAVGYALAAPFCPHRILPGLAALGDFCLVFLAALVAGTVAACCARSRTPVLGGLLGGISLTVPLWFFLVGPFIGSVRLGPQSFLSWMWLRWLLVLLGLASVGAVSGASGVVAFQRGGGKDQTKRGRLGKIARVVALVLLGPVVVAGYRWAFVRITLADKPDIERRLFEFLPDVTYEDGEVVKLSLENSFRFSDRDLKKLGILPKLRDLNLAGTAIVGPGLVYLKTVPNLERLRLDGTDLNDEGLDAIGGLSHLRYLDLGGTKILDAGIVHLVPCRDLQHLILSDTSVGDQGARQIARIGSLARLDLARTNVTNQGVKELETLKNLEDLWVTESPSLTEAGCAALKNTNPRLCIHLIRSRGQ